MSVVDSVLGNVCRILGVLMAIHGIGIPLAASADDTSASAQRKFFNEMKQQKQESLRSKPMPAAFAPPRASSSATLTPMTPDSFAVRIPSYAGPGCAPDLTYLQGSLTSRLTADPQFQRSLSRPIDQIIRDAGSLDRAIVLTRMQQDANYKSLRSSEQCERASRAAGPANEASSAQATTTLGACESAAKVMKDTIMLTGGALEAFECRKRAGGR